MKTQRAAILAIICVATARLMHAQPTPPTVATLPASALGPTTATLEGTANPWVEPTFGWFQWGTTTNYGNTTTPQYLGTGLGNTNFSRVLGGLIGGLTYHFRAVATNADGTGFGTNQSFTVSGLTNTSTSFVLSALTTFGAGDGWLAPGEGGYTFLGTGNNERGLAYGNGHLYLVSHNGNFIRILDALTGSDLGALSTNGISGGTFGVNMIAVGGDGVIYVGNLTIDATASPFKIYKWANEGSTPTVVYSGNAGLAGSRVGDSFAIIGSGSSTRLAAGFNSTPAVTGNNGYTIIDSTAGTAMAIGFGATPPHAGDFRLGLTFSDSSHVLGTQGSSLYRHTSFAGATGTLIGSPTIPDPPGAIADRLLAYAVVGGMPLLAVQSIGDSHVSIYDVSSPAAPVWLASGNSTSGALTANANATGALAWGDIGQHAAHLWAMSSNQGIQAFLVVVPTPNPALGSSRLNDKIVLSWATNNSAGFGLESSTNAGPPTFWTSVSPPAVVSGTNYVVTNSIVGDRKFYRLKK